MLHVRLVSPAAVTRPLTDRLAAAPGVQNVVVRAGAASRPDGDAIQFDVHDAAAPFPQGVRPVADLINTPNIFSVIVAVLAGLVEVVSLTESRANALIGVFISVTTIPAAASVGVSIAYSSWSG